MQEELKYETVLLRGNFYFIGDKRSNFKGPIKKGFRPIVWCSSVDKATSCSFLSDEEITEGQTKQVDIILLNQLALGCNIEKGIVLNVGTTKHRIGEFTVVEHLGKWQGGKVP